MNLKLPRNPLCLCLLAGSIYLFSQTAAMSAAGVTVTPAVGGAAISADTAGGGWTSLTGPVLAESDRRQIQAGNNIVLNAPSGFAFDTGTTPVVTLTAGDSSANRNINNASVGSSIGPVTVTASTISVFIFKRSNRTPNTLTWSNIRVRPTAGTPLASGNITRSTGAGNSVLIYATGGGSDSNWGALAEVAGTLAGFEISPISSPQTAGTSFAIDSITAKDQFNNTVTGFTGTVDLTETGGGAGGSVSPLQSDAFSGGVRSSQSVTLTRAGTGVTITATDHAGTGKTGASGAFDVNPGSASRLVITSVPGSATVGADFPVTVQSQDAYGNPANVVSATGISLAASGSGTLSGHTGTINGSANSVTLSSVQYTKAESITLIASRSSGDNLATSAASSSITVSKGTPTVMTWGTASAITYGQTLASSTLSGGSATPAGSFAFTTPSAAPVAGSAPQNVTFTPADTANYNSVGGSVSVSVNKANPAVTTWPTASAITYGQTLASSTLSGGSASPTGSFAFTTPSTAPGAGTAPQSVTFTPTDTANYNNASASASVTVNPLPVILTGTRAYDRTTTAAAAILTVANKVGSDAVTVASGSGTLASKDVGTRSISDFASLTLGGGASANYTLSGASGSVTITAAALSITANDDSKAFGDTKTYGAGSTAFSSAGLQNGETIGSVTITASGGTGASDPVGSYALTPSVAVGGSFNAGNYSITYHDGTLVVMPAGHVTMTLDNYLGPTEIVVKFVAKNGDGQIVGEDEMAFPASGPNVQFSIGVPANAATLSVKPRFYLRKKFVVSQIAGQNDVSLDLGTFLGGDVYEDNQVDLTDYSWLKTCWGNSGPLYPINGNPTDDPKNFPDLNGDESIDALDYSVLKNGWYQMGDPE